MTLRSDSVFRGVPLGCVGSCSLLVPRPANPGRMLSPASVALSGCTAARLAPAVPRRDAKLRWSARPAPRPMTSCRFAAFPGGYEKPGQIVPPTNQAHETVRKEYRRQGRFRFLFRDPFLEWTLVGTCPTLAIPE